MLYGLTGAHRSGKTTLARAVAEELGIEFYETSTSKVAKELGYDAVGSLTLAERVHLQTHLLANHIEEVSKRGRPLIVDRTPLDFIGYLACEFTMANGADQPPELLAQAAQLVQSCLNATRQLYDFVFYLAPLPVYVVEEGKPADNPIYQMHNALVVMGSLAQLRDQTNYALVFETDWEVRRSFVHETIVTRLDHIETHRRTASYLC